MPVSPDVPLESGGYALTDVAYRSGEEPYQYDGETSAVIGVESGTDATDDIV